MGIEHWLAAAGDLLLGASCHGCGQPWWGICPLCREQVASRRPFLTTPVPCPDGFPVTVTSSIYDPILRRLISAHKERQALAERNAALIDEGMQMLNKALELRPDYDDAMAYLNLLYREKADLQEVAEARDADLKTADEWMDKSLEVKRQKALEAQRSSQQAG